MSNRGVFPRVPSGASIRTPRNAPEQQEWNENPKLQALSKQLSQLDAAGRKVFEASRFLVDLQSSTDTKVDMSQAPQQLKLLRDLRCKLKATNSELQRLDDAVQQHDNNRGSSCQSTQNLGPALSSHAIRIDVTSPCGSDGGSPQAQDRKGQAFRGHRDVELTPRPELSPHVELTPCVSVTETVVKLQKDHASEQQRAVAKLREEKRRLQAAQNEALELEAANQKLRLKIETGPDLKALREQAALLQLQAEEVMALQASIKQLAAIVEEMPKLQEEAEKLRPAAEEARQMAGHLAEMKLLDASRRKLQASINVLQPKMHLVQRMQGKVKELEDVVEAGAPLAARVAELQAEVDRLPELRQKMFLLKAGAAEVRQLEAILSDYGRQEEFRARLQEKEVELQARVSGIAELKRRVEVLQLKAIEVDQLESQVAMPPPAASSRSRGSSDGGAGPSGKLLGCSRRPQLKESQSEVEELQHQHSHLKEVLDQRRHLQGQKEQLKRQDSVESLQQQLGNSHSDGIATPVRNPQGLPAQLPPVTPTRQSSRRASTGGGPFSVGKPPLRSQEPLRQSLTLVAPPTVLRETGAPQAPPLACARTPTQVVAAGKLLPRHHSLRASLPMAPDRSAMMRQSRESGTGREARPHASCTPGAPGATGGSTLRQSLPDMAQLLRRSPGAALLPAVRSSYTGSLGHQDAAARHLRAAQPPVHMVVNLVEQVVVGVHVHEPAIQLCFNINVQEPATEPEHALEAFSHCAPHLEDGLVNLLSPPSSPGAFSPLQNPLQGPCASSSSPGQVSSNASTTRDQASGPDTPGASEFQRMERLTPDSDRQIKVIHHSPLFVHRSGSSIEPRDPHELLDKLDEVFMPFSIPDPTLMFDSAGCRKRARKLFCNTVAMGQEKGDEVADAGAAKVVERETQGETAMATWRVNKAAEMDTATAKQLVMFRSRGGAPEPPPPQQLQRSSWPGPSEREWFWRSSDENGRAFNAASSLPRTDPDVVLVDNPLGRRSRSGALLKPPMTKKQLIIQSLAASTAVVALEERIAQLQETLKHKGALEGELKQLEAEAEDLSRMRARAAALAGVRGKLEAVEEQYRNLVAEKQRLQEMEEEVEVLSSYVQDMSAVQQQHSTLKERHQLLLRLSAESAVIQKDCQMLSLQASVSVAMFTPSTSINLRPADLSAGPSACGDHSSDSQAPGDQNGGAAQGREVAMHAASSGVSSGAGAGATPLGSAVFQKMRTLEAENLGLVAEVEELQAKVLSLEDSLEASAVIVSRLKDVSKMVGIIRGRKSSLTTVG